MCLGNIISESIKFNRLSNIFFHHFNSHKKADLTMERSRKHRPGPVHSFPFVCAFFTSQKLVSRSKSNASAETNHSHIESKVAREMRRKNIFSRYKKNVQIAN